MKSGLPKGIMAAQAALAALAALACIPSASARQQQAGTSPPDHQPAYVRVWLVALDVPADSTPGPAVQVRIGLGGSRMFESDRRPFDQARWNHSIRLGTRKSLPITFDVVVHRSGSVADNRSQQARSDERRPQERVKADRRPTREQDSILAMGFQDLVGDFDGETESRDSRTRVEGRAAEPVLRGRNSHVDSGRVVCRASMKWPPANGTHRLPCGKANLVVRIRAE